MVRTIAGLLPAYLILELFVFSLVWIFVEKNPLESYRRSLGTYLFALIEFGLLFSVRSRWPAAQNHLLRHSIWP